jgi:hypothetical protein
MASALAFAWPQIIVAHFPLYTAWVDPIPARDDPFVKDFVEDRFMQGLPLLRGE